jgi:hypothetical protein
MNELSPTDKHTFVFMENNHLYYFSLSDLTRMIIESLTYSYVFEPEPLQIKNPYTNHPFSKSTLYNIYFQMRKSLCIVPKLIQMFFDADFHVYDFKIKNLVYLREYVIRRYIEKADPNAFFPEILRLIRKYDRQRVMKIHSDFSPTILLDAFKPYLVTEYFISYGASIYRPYYTHSIKRNISRFIQDNPDFGKKIEYNSPHYFPGIGGARFYYVTAFKRPKTNYSSDFMTTHQYSENTYNRYYMYGVTSTNDLTFNTYVLNRSQSNVPYGDDEDEDEHDDDDDEEDHREDEDEETVSQQMNPRPLSERETENPQEEEQSFETDNPAATDNPAIDDESDNWLDSDSDSDSTQEEIVVDTDPFTDDQESDKDSDKSSDTDTDDDL